MELVNVLSFFRKYKKGTYTRVVKETTTESGYKKVTKMVGRFVNYYNIKEVVMSGKSEKESKPRLFEEQIIPHILKKNLNTLNVLLCVYTTKHHKARTTYYHNGYEITEEEYYLHSGEKKKSYGETPVFNFKLKDVVKLG